MALGLGSSLVKGGASLLTYVKDNLKLYLDFTSTKSDTLKFPSEGSTSFDGVDDYIDCGNNSSVQITGALSISSWIKTDNNSKYMFLVNKNDNTNVCYYSEVFNNGQLFFRIVSGGTNYEVGNTANTQIADGNWHHYCCVFEPSTSLKIYIDGELKQTNTTSIPATIDNDTVDLEIGRRGDNSNYFEGQMTNVGLWSRALTQEEVQSIMNKSYSQLKGVETTSLVSWWALDTAPDTLGNNLITNGTFDSDLSSWSTSSSHWQWDNGRAYAYSGSNYQFRTSSVISWTTGATYNVSFDIEWVSGSSLSFYLDGTLITITSDTTSVNQNVVHTSGAGYFQIYNNSSVVYIDNIVVKELKIKDSESTNHGSVTGATTTTSVYGGNAPILPRAIDVAKEGQADAIGNGSALFNGSTDHVELSGSSPSNAFSISAWVFDTHASGSDFSAIYSANGATIWFGVKNNSSGKVRLHINGNYRYVDTPDGSFSSPSNEWIHLVGTWDGTNAKIYINGVSQTLSITGTPSNPSAQTDPHIGINSTDSGLNQWTGSISQVGIWQGALTQAQVQSVMEATSYSKIPSSVKSTTNTLVTTGDWTLSGSWSYDSSTGYYTNTYVNSIDTPVGNILASPTTTQGNLYKLSYTVVSATGSPILKFPNNMLGLSDSNIPYTVGETNVHYGVDDGSNENIGIRNSTGVGTIVLKDIKFEEVTNDIVAYYPLDGSSSRGNGTDDVTTGEVLGSELVTSNTTSDWAQYGSGGSEANTANGVALTAGSDTRNAYRTVSGLTDGKLYKLNVDAYYSGSSDTVKIEIIPGSGSLFTPALTTTSTNYSIYFVKNSGTMYILNNGVNTGNVVYVENLSIKEVTSNTGVLK